MNTKRIMLLAIIFALPITANADYIYNTVRAPARVANNGTVTVASYGPYVLTTIENDDDEHIASTAYVKGAYNDTIAAVNWVSEVASAKQPVLHSYDDEDPVVYSELLSAEEFINSIVDDDIETMTNSLMTAYGVAVGLQSQRVEIYTTWDDDDATTDVAFKTVVPQN